MFTKEEVFLIWRRKAGFDDNDRTPDVDRALRREIELSPTALTDRTGAHKIFQRRIRAELIAAGATGLKQVDEGGD